MKVYFELYLYSKPEVSWAYIAYSAKVTLPGILYFLFGTRILFDAVIRTKFIYFVTSIEENMSEEGKVKIFVPL